MPTRLEDVPPHLIVDFDLTDPTLAVPHARLAELQATTPVAYCPNHGGYWLVTRYDDVYEVTTNWHDYTSTAGSIPGPVQHSIPLRVDPPAHGAYRRIINPLFSPSRMTSLGDQIRDTTTRLIDGFAARGECDFIAEFAHPLPSATFCALMGWPLSDAGLFDDWGDRILVGKPGAPAEEDMAVRVEASQQVFAYFTDVIASHRRTITDDVTSQIIHADFDGERPLTDDELLKMFWLLMLGGLHTVRGVLGFGLINLINDPEQRRRLVEDPRLIPSAVEEMLRMDPPATPGRAVVNPVTLSGVDLLPGDVIMAMVSAASRDPSHFEDPHRLLVDRSPNRHLAFSAGPHRCVGSHLARIELGIALEEIHRRIPDYRLVPDRPPVLHHGQVRGLYELPIAFTPTD